MELSTGLFWGVETPPAAFLIGDRVDQVTNRIDRRLQSRQARAKGIVVCAYRACEAARDGSGLSFPVVTEKWTGVRHGHLPHDPVELSLKRRNAGTKRTGRR